MFPVIYRRKVRFSDTDAQGIVFNANYPRYWDDAVTDYFDELGIPWDEMVAAGYEMVLGHLEIDFRASAKLGDNVANGVGVTEAGRSSVVFEARSWIEPGEATVVEGKLVQVFVDATTFRPADVPAFFLEAVGRLQGAPVPRSKRGPRPIEEPPSPPVRYLEDFNVGEVIEGGPYVVTEGEILSFARQYDPQALHIDAEWAEEGPFGGLIASGWHTGAMSMRLMVEHFISPQTSLGSPGLDEIRWLAPVRAGDELSVRVTVEKVEPSSSAPQRGSVHSKTELLNQDGDVVMVSRGRGLYLRRPTENG